MLNVIKSYLVILVVNVGLLSNWSNLIEINLKDFFLFLNFLTTFAIIIYNLLKGMSQKIKSIGLTNLFIMKFHRNSI